MRVALFGRHSHRTPLAYPAYQGILGARVEIVAEPRDADLLVTGFSLDLKENADSLVALLDDRPDLRIVVVSEEPLWDSVWTEHFSVRNSSLELAGRRVSFTQLNHCTSSIFDFEKYPYFITTSDDFFVRYAAHFSRNVRLTRRDIADLWSTAALHAVFMAEKREDPRYDVTHDDVGVIGLSCYRTRVASAFDGDRVRRVGRGWDDAVRRQALPDWHLDKLVSIDRQALLVSAIENTVHPQYVTEKVFDAFASLAMPIYYAPPDHRLLGLVPQGSFLNVAGMSETEAADAVRDFSADEDAADAYLEAQRRLCTIFSRPDDFQAERARAIDCLMAELEGVA